MKQGSILEQLKLLTDVALDLQAGPPLEEVLRLLVEQSARLLNTPHVSIRLLDLSHARLRATYRAGESLHQEPQEFQVGEGLVGWVAARGLTLRCPDMESDPRFVARPGSQWPLGSFLGVPLLSGGRCMGVLAAVHPENDYFTPEHEQLLSLLCVVAIPHLIGTDPDPA